MIADWFEIDPDRDRMPAPLQERYRLRDPWGDYARAGEVIPITFAGSTRHGRALVTGHDDDGQAVVLPIDDDVVLIYSDPPEDMPANIPATVTPLSDQGALHRSSAFATGGEAS